MIPPLFNIFEHYHWNCDSLQMFVMVTYVLELGMWEVLSNSLLCLLVLKIRRYLGIRQ